MPLDVVRNPSRVSFVTDISDLAVPRIEPVPRRTAIIAAVNYA
jgi:hypothetical protein